MSNKILYVYAWAITMFFGTIVSETILLYPNIFHDVPHSLTVAMSFMKVIGPGQLFPILGSGILILGIVTIITNRKNKPAIRYILISFLLMLLFEFLFSVFFSWPRNAIMFTEGESIHSREYLIQVAREFQIGHWLRLSISGICSGLAFMALYADKN